MATDDKFITDNMGLAYKLAWQLYKKYSKYIELDDIQSLCFIGLIKAARTFDVTKNFTFSTYAYRVMKNEFLIYVRKNKKHFNNISLNTIIKLSDDDVELGDVIPDDYDINEDLERSFIINNLKQYLNYLTDIEIKILFYRLDGLTQIEIGDKLNLSQAQVSRLYSILINKLRFRILRTRREELEDEYKE